MLDNLSDEQLEQIEKIQKLLNLGAKAGTPAEAEAANAKAQELLLQYNLDAAVVARFGDIKAGKREQAAVEGGFYAFQRELWRDVAKLNFCVYWNQEYLSDEIWQGRRVKKRRHALIGRIVNTRATIAMATYLQQAIERILNDHLVGDGDVKFANRMSNYAFSYRKGAALTIRQKLHERRSEILEKERREAEEAAILAGSKATSMERGLTIAAYSKSEEEANEDFRFGEGYSAKKAAEKMAEADRRQRMEQAYTKWAKENPKEAMSKFRFKDEKTGTVWHYGRAYGGPTGAGSRGGSDGIDYSAFRAGQEEAQSVGLDPQTATEKRELLK